MRKNALLSFAGIFLLFSLMLQCGCFRVNDYSSSPSNDFSKIAGPVSFKILLPKSLQSENIIASSKAKIFDVTASRGIRASNENVEPKVTFKLKLVNVGNAAMPLSTVLKVVPVIGKTAVATFSGIPACPCIGEISIVGGNIDSYTEFHGAIDLERDKHNILKLVPVNSKMKQDFIAHVVKQVVTSPLLFGKAIPNLVNSIEQAILTLDTQKDTAYNDAVQLFAGFVDVKVTISTGTADVPNISYVSIKGRVVSVSKTPISGVSVSLLYSNNGVITDTGATAISTIAGEFIFSGLASGIYIIKSASNTQYLESSKLGDASAANADVGDLLLLPQVTTSTTPTMDITGTIEAALKNSPLSAAQVFVDTGYATVTNVNGQFTLPYVERGIRTVKIEKPGFGSTTITLEVKGEVIGSTPPTAQEITYSGQTLTPVAPATRTIDLGIKIALFEIHENGILAGTVQRYVPNADGTPSAAKQAYPNFNFDLWVILPDKSATPWGTVVTNTDGTWQKVAPPNADNKFEWVAVVPNTQSQTAQDGSGGTVTTWVNSTWAGNPILSRGWLVEGGKTTIMNFDVWDPAVIANTLPNPLLNLESL